MTVLGFYYSNGTPCSRCLVPVLWNTEWLDRWVGCQVGIFTASKTGGFWTLLLRQIDWSRGQCGQCVSVHKANPPWSAADPSAASLSDLQPSSLCKSKRHWGSFTFIHQVDRRPIDVSLHALRVPARHNDWPPLPARTIARRHCRQTVLAYWPKPVQTAALVIDRLFIQERGWRSV